MCALSSIRRQLVEEGEYPGLLWFQALAHFLLLTIMVLSQKTLQRMIQVGIEYPWMNIALAANARSVAKFLRSRFHSLNYVFLPLCLRFETGLRLKLAHGDDRPSPGTKILRGEVLAADLTQIVIHLARFDGAPNSVLVNVLEEFLAR